MTLPLSVSFPVHWNEMDAYGHVNNTRYFVWFETARIALFDSLGLTDGWEGQIRPVVASTTCDYLQPVHYPAQAVVKVWLSRIGRSSFTTNYAVSLEGAPDTIVAKGSAVVVLTNLATQRSTPMPADLRQALEGHLREA